MATHRTDADKRRAYFRAQDEAAERLSPVVGLPVRRALRDEARLEGVELSVGDPDDECSCYHARSAHSKEGKCFLAGCPCGGLRIPRASKLRKSLGEEPGLFVLLEKNTKDEDHWPHKYRSKHRSPGGNWVYVYDEDDGPRRTGMTGQEQAKPPIQGQERARKGRQVAKAPDWIKNYFTGQLRVPEQTRKVIDMAVESVGRQRFEDMAHNIADRHPHLADPVHEGAIMEAAGRDLLSRHKAASERLGPGPSESGKRPGGNSPGNSITRQPWQMTSDEHKQGREAADPKLMGKDHHAEVLAAVRRGERVPWGAMADYPDAVKEYEANPPKMDLSPETQAYVEKFDKLTADLPKRFDAWVRPEVRKEGDALLASNKASGYNIDEKIDGYDVGDAGVYSHLMTDKTKDSPIVMYHMYAQHAAHGKEMLALLHERGLNPEYTVVKRASAVLWDPENEGWAKEDEMTYRDVDTPEGKKTVGYSSDYIIAFRARSQQEADALYDAIAEKGNMTYAPQQAIPRAWYVPDVRASQRVDSFAKKFLNVKQVGSQELCVLTKYDWIRGGDTPAAEDREEASQGAEERGDYDPSFRRDHVWLDREAKTGPKRTPEGSRQETGKTLADVIKSQDEVALYVRL